MNSLQVESRDVNLNRAKKHRHRQNQINKILERDGDKCWLCNRNLNGDYSLYHVIPYSDGGKKVLENLRLAHTRCNNTRYNPTHIELNEIYSQIKDGSYTYYEEFLTELL